MILISNLQGNLTIVLISAAFSTAILYLYRITVTLMATRPYLQISISIVFRLLLITQTAPQLCFMQLHMLSIILTDYSLTRYLSSNGLTGISSQALMPFTLIQ